MPEKLSPTERPNIAEQTGLDTVGRDKFLATAEQFPWLDEERTINTTVVESLNGRFQFGNTIGGSRRLAKIATDEMLGRETDDDRLNDVMYNAIQAIMSGNPGTVKRVKNAPEGTDMYYGGLSNGARVYFVDAGRDNIGMRIFLKIALCGSKNSEPRVLSTLSGKKTSV